MSEEKNEKNKAQEQKYPTEFKTASQMLKEKEAQEESQEQKQDDYRLVEERDDQQIMDELRGKLLEKEYIYDFKSGSHRIVGLTYAGIVTVARKQGNIRVIEVKISESDEKVIAKARGRDDINNFEIWGVATQLKRIRTQYGSEYEDVFATVKAVAKAQRNVLRRLIPESVIKVKVEEYLKSKNDGSTTQTDAKSFM